MEFDKVINSRKTIRKYIKKNISDSDIESILQSAMLAPSAKNRQPWRFYILDNTQKDKITSMMYKWDKTHRDLKTSVKGSANQMLEANKAIIIYSPIYHSRDKKAYFKKPDYLSLGAAIENMSLQCCNLGLGSCWLCDTLYIENEINELLNIKDFEQISTLLIGYPKEIPERRERFKLKDLILNDQIGN